MAGRSPPTWSCYLHGPCPDSCCFPCHLSMSIPFLVGSSIRRKRKVKMDKESPGTAPLVALDLMFSSAIYLPAGFRCFQHPKKALPWILILISWVLYIFLPTLAFFLSVPFLSLFYVCGVGGNAISCCYCLKMDLKGDAFIF